VKVGYDEGARLRLTVKAFAQETDHFSRVAFALAEGTIVPILARSYASCSMVGELNHNFSSAEAEREGVFIFRHVIPFWKIVYWNRMPFGQI
jgi:hypothetical protein